MSKQALQENKAHQIFQKTSISYPLLRTPTCAYQWVRNFFGKIWHALFSWNTRFEIRAFALLPTESANKNLSFDRLLSLIRSNNWVPDNCTLNLFCTYTLYWKGHLLLYLLFVVCFHELYIAFFIYQCNVFVRRHWVNYTFIFYRKSYRSALFFLFRSSPYSHECRQRRIQNHVKNVR